MNFRTAAALTAAALIPDLVTPQECTLCPDGSPSSMPEAALPFINQTCGELEFFIPFINGTDCEETQATFAPLCGCPGVERDSSCTICPDGSPINPSLDDNATEFCALFEAITFFGELNETECGSIQSATALACGCPGVEPCSVCPGGEEPTIPEFVFPDGEGTCADFATNVSMIANGTEICTSVHQSVSLFCGCPSAPEPTCTLCPGDADPLLPDLVPPGADGLSCAEAKFFARGFPEEECAEMVPMVAASCGCPGDEMADDVLATDDYFTSDDMIGKMMGMGASKTSKSGTFTVHCDLRLYDALTLW